MSPSCRPLFFGASDSSLRASSERQYPTPSGLGIPVLSGGRSRFISGNSSDLNIGGSNVDRDFVNYFNIRERFIQRLMKDGKKSIATKIFDESLEIFYQTIQQTSNDELTKQFLSKSNRKKSTVDWEHIQNMGKSDLFLAAFFRAKPWFGTSSIRRGGKKVLIPEILSPKQQESIAIRWLVTNSRTFSGKSTSEGLASEFLGCLTDQGKTMSQRAQIHQLAEANRASIGLA